MATLTVPPAVPSPAEDCEQLRKAFAGPFFDYLWIFCFVFFDHEMGWWFFGWVDESDIDPMESE